MISHGVRALSAPFILHAASMHAKPRDSPAPLASDPDDSPIPGGFTLSRFNPRLSGPIDGIMAWLRRLVLRFATTESFLSGLSSSMINRPCTRTTRPIRMLPGYKL